MFLPSPVFTRNFLSHSAKPKAKVTVVLLQEGFNTEKKKERPGLKQIELCFSARAGCEAALRSDGRLCLQSYYACTYDVYLFMCAVMKTNRHSRPIVHFDQQQTESLLTER